jgi:two-component system cell cycle response regulator CpdR
VVIDWQFSRGEEQMAPRRQRGKSLRCAMDSCSSVLIIDDDETIRAVVALCLENYGYHVTCANGRDSVISLLMSVHFDLVITDLIMPDLDCMDIIVALSSHSTPSALLVMTGAVDPTHDRGVVLARQTRDVGILMKPFHLTALIAAVEKTLERERVISADLTTRECHSLPPC